MKFITTINAYGICTVFYICQSKATQHYSIALKTFPFLVVGY